MSDSATGVPMPKPLSWNILQWSSLPSCRERGSELFEFHSTSSCALGNVSVTLVCACNGHCYARGWFVWERTRNDRGISATLGVDCI